MGVIENMKDIADLIKKAGDIELYRKITESEGEVMDLTRENRRLEDRVQELEKTLALQKQMTFRQPFWYQEADETPFCPACWENHKKAIHVVFAQDGNNFTRWGCPSCKQFYDVRKAGASSRIQFSGQAGNYGPDSWLR
jgi:hypothetical protein